MWLMPSLRADRIRLSRLFVKYRYPHGPAPRHRQHQRRGRHSAARKRIGLRSAAVVVAFSAIGALFVSVSPGNRPATVVQVDAVQRGDGGRAAFAENRASRGGARTGDQSSQQPAAPAGAQPTQSPAPGAASAAPTKASPSPTVHTPIGGLAQAEMDNAVTIIQAGQRLDLPERAFVVAIATALQESHLHNLANSNVPESLKLPNEGVGSDHDSVGLFQQRPNWGTVAQLMNPAEAARRFYAALVQVQGWEQMSVTVAAQTVQVSAFPDAYAQWQTLAGQIVDAVA
ncbi:hypothetical protein ACPPVO_58330 [Dactylosporangium sp. McL0621]|uniref:hypothetical protein n=1 Tax=Dactylosporangium sp. McL0621 TaxID=3415678 RepID=UPI003CF49988